MGALLKPVSSRERAAALIIVLAFVVLLTGLSVAYLSRTTSDRQVAHSSYNQSRADQLAASAMDLVIGNLRQEITGPSPTPAPPYLNANVLPARSGNPPIVGGVDPIPNLIRRSVRSDIVTVPSLASAVNSTTDVSANGRFVSLPRWNKHYLVPKLNTGDDKADPVASFTAPDWVFVTNNGATVITQANSSVVGRYAYAVFDEGGLLDMNVAGNPTDPSVATAAVRVGRKGSIAYADLSALGNYPILNPDGTGVYQVDRLVGWRNYATTQPTNNFPDSAPASQAFARNFQTDSAPATNFYNYVVNNTTGFLSTNTATWQVNSKAIRTDQSFVQRQELIALRSTIGSTTSFSTNALQYLTTFSRDTNSPSFSPSTPVGSTIDYAALASTANATNPNFLLRKVPTSPALIRFDGTTAAVGEPLVKTRFPLSRLAWLTYKGPSATLATSDAVYLALTGAGVSTTTIAAGTAANIQTCFGLTFGGTTGAPWTYFHGAANRILRLDEVAAAGREPDFFELLQAAISSGSLGQYTNTGGAAGGVTGGSVFPDIHMSSTTHHILSIGAAIIDQADPDSIPTRIQFTGGNSNTWTACGVENLPYITEIYPIAGTSPDTPTQWASYLLFQLWNPHQSPADVANKVRLRIDGGIGIFAGGNGQTWNTANTVNVYPPVGQVTFVTITKPASFSIPAPLATDYTSVTSTAPGTFAFLPAPAVPTPTP